MRIKVAAMKAVGTVGLAIASIAVVGATPAMADSTGGSGPVGVYVCYLNPGVTVGGPVPISAPLVTAVTTDPNRCPPGSSAIGV